MKYYVAQNVGQPIVGIQFEKFEIVGGTSFGVYKTEDAAEIAKLEALIGKSSVQSIDEAEYDRCLKKKPRSFDGSKLLSTPSELTETYRGHAIKGNGALVVDQNEPPEHVESKIEVKQQVSSVEDALKIESIPAPEGSAADPMAAKPDTREPFANKKSRKR